MSIPVLYSQIFIQTCQTDRDVLSLLKFLGQESADIDKLFNSFHLCDSLEFEYTFLSRFFCVISSLMNYVCPVDLNYRYSFVSTTTT